MYLARFVDVVCDVEWFWCGAGVERGRDMDRARELCGV